MISCSQANNSNKIYMVYSAIIFVLLLSLKRLHISNCNCLQTVLLWAPLFKELIMSISKIWPISKFIRYSFELSLFYTLHVSPLNTLTSTDLKDTFDYNLFWLYLHIIHSNANGLVVNLFKISKWPYSVDRCIPLIITS